VRRVFGAQGSQRGRRAVEDDLALVHERDLRAGGPDVLDEVGGHDHGGSLAELAEQGAEVDPLLRVEPGGRLVEQQQFGLVDDGLRDAHPAEHPAGQGAQLRLGLATQVDPLDRGRHRGRYPGGRHLLQQREILHELRHREARVVAEVLRQVPEPAAHLAPGAVNTRVPAEQPQPAGGRRDHGGHHAQQRGLARSVRAEQAEYPGTSLQAHPGHGLIPAEPPGQIGDLDVHHRVPLGIRVA
jgi:hypothetical protein